MSFAPQFQIPGGFNFEASAAAGQPLHANIFRPPESPSSSSYNLAKSTGSLFSDISMSAAQPTGAAKRKRASTRESTPLDWQMNIDGAHDGRNGETGHLRYTLAGQISTTPASAPIGAENGVLEDSVYSDIDYRRALGPKTVPNGDAPSALIPDRTTASTPGPAGWTLPLLSLQTIGDIVGKVWEFCKKGAFRGFQAGGGQGYDVNGSTVTETTGQPWSSQTDAPIQPADDTPMNQDTAACISPLAPQPETPSSSQYQDTTTPESTPRPAAKRRQVSANNDELRNWVVVEEPSDQKPKRFAAEVKAAAARPSGLARPRPGYFSQTAASSHRRISAPSQRFTGAAPSLARAPTRPPLHISHAGSPNLTPREPASFASPRSSPVSHTTPSRIPLGTTQHRRNQSAASAAATTAASRRRSMLLSSDDIQAASPRLDAEARQLAQRKLAAERDVDSKVDALNARLLSMIRQGREALGTKVEVEMLDEMDTGVGWEDDD
ncbi:uncharacterized protein B0T15DRAFT_393114 [Chaetomium strumarium]|uniref:Uncharacterized protein n=1 Tax=Chaetomium strumarium TaxID=1170767 RepID=A0AAJ0GWA9_9PEZI|nr:hypothetical protein B0T15DRAFT_393114 [Chaetomium strumarium]